MLVITQFSQWHTRRVVGRESPKHAKHTYDIKKGRDKSWANLAAKQHTAIKQPAPFLWVPQSLGFMSLMSQTG